MATTKSTLKRTRHSMPAFVRSALQAGRVLEAYRARPPYQRNDYLGWIAQAKREDTKRKRVAQMVSELERGGVYMRMKWSGDTKPTAGKASTPRKARSQHAKPARKAAKPRRRASASARR